MPQKTITKPIDQPWIAIRYELVNFVNRRVNNSEAAEDIVQEIFERLHRTSKSSVIENPQAWLYRAARNATIDYYRTRRPTSNLDESYDSDNAEKENSEPNSATQELANCLRPLITQLPNKYRKAITLVDLEGNTQQQAADLEQISLSGMKSRVQRGRTKLGELLIGCCTVTTDSNDAITDYKPETNCDC